MNLAPLWLRTLCAAIPCIFLTTACGGDDDDDNDDNEKTTVTDEPAGGNCAYGGVAITTDGVTQYVCKQTSSVLLLTSTESAGGNCTYGGTKIEAGTDDDGNGVLDASEVDSTQYSCDADPYAGQSFSSFYIEDASQVADAQGYSLIRGYLEFDFPEGQAAQELTFSSLRYVQRYIGIDCDGQGLTLHFPELEEIGESLYVDGCTNAVIDAPKLRKIGEELYAYGESVSSLSLPALVDVAQIEIYSTSLTSLSLPALQSVRDVDVDNNASLDECSLLAGLTAAQHAGSSMHVSLQSNVTCTDLSIACPYFTIGSSTEQFRACYTRATWLDAREQCQSFGTGWDLAYVTSDDELATWTGTGALSNDNFWLGYSDDPTNIDTALEGTFVWVQNATDNTYAPQTNTSDPLFWDSDQPDNNGGNENCVELYYQDDVPGLRANDVTCDDVGQRALCRVLQ